MENGSIPARIRNVIMIFGVQMLKVHMDGKYTR